jgi:S-DNA-T family DNA segregation ATPase FtsK/SpoIIIE
MSKNKKQAKVLKAKAKKFPRPVDPHAEEQRETSQIIEAKCRDLTCPGHVVSVRRGPVVTAYKFVPLRTTRLAKIKAVNEDIAASTQSEAVTCMRVPGEEGLTITIPNKEREIVEFKDTLKNVKAHRSDMILPINLGVTSTGDPLVADLTKIGPHMLIAGTTNAGKSVLINAILCSLLQVRSPKELQIKLIDLKMVELVPFSEVPHIQGQMLAIKKTVESTVLGALGMMEELLGELERRQGLLLFHGVKNIRELHDKLRARGEASQIERMPYILLVIDEMSDLALRQKKIFVERMSLLAQKGRASGVHIIAATQHPSVQVLPGEIKANFAARVSLRLASQSSSRTVFEQAGAEQLLMGGDILVKSSLSQGLLRAHGPWCRQEDIDRTIQGVKYLGWTDRVMIDGIPELKEQTVSSAVQAQVGGAKNPNIPEGISYKFLQFLRVRNFTWAAYTHLSKVAQDAVQNEFKTWQQKQRKVRVSHA